MKLISKNLNLQDREWRTFANIFWVKGTKTTPLKELKEFGKGQHPYVTTQATNNGVESFYDYKTEQGNCLCVDSAVIGYVSYQPMGFSASDHVEVIRIKNKNFSPYVAMFLVTLLNRECYRYNYGRKRAQMRIKKEILRLPVTAEGQPDWQFMEDYIKSLPYSSKLEQGFTLKQPSAEPIINQRLRLADREWLYFAFSNIFSIHQSSDDPLVYYNSGNTPYVASSAKNNGVTGYVNAAPTNPSGSITINSNGSVGEAFYQSQKYICSGDVKILQHQDSRPLNPYIGMFLCAVLQTEKYRFSFGRKSGMKRLCALKIKLPVNAVGQPDWQFIEDYIKSLPYSSHLAHFCQTR